jgi:hypothetical protein
LRLYHLFFERENAFVDKVIKDLEAMYNNKPKDSLPQTQKTDKISPSLDKRYLEEYHQPSSAKLTQMSTESEAFKLPLCACWMKVCASVVTSCRLKTLCIISSKYG